MTSPRVSKSPTPAATTPLQRPSLPTIISSIKVEQHLVAAETTESIAASELSSDAPRKHKRRSTGSIDLTYRYHEPSDDELSWTEDEHGKRRRRKSKRKNGAGDDFRTGIIPSDGKKRRRRRRSGQNEQEGEEGEEYSGSESESDSHVSDDSPKKPRRKRLSGKSDDFKTGIIPREGKARRKRRSSSGKGNGTVEEPYLSESEISTDSDNDEKGPSKRKKPKKRLSGKGDDFKTGIPHVESHRRKKRKSNAQEEDLGDDSFHDDSLIPLNDENRNSIAPSTPSTRKSFPPLSDGWTNIEWTILEHTHDHIRGLGGPSPEKINPTKIAEAFVRIYETSELKKKAEEEGMEKKEFTVEEVRDRIVALRKIRDRRRSGELPPARRLDQMESPGEKGEGIGGARRRISGIFGKFW